MSMHVLLSLVLHMESCLVKGLHLFYGNCVLHKKKKKMVKTSALLLGLCIPADCYQSKESM